MKILIIGLGNPILGDDGVGWKVVEEVNKNLPDLSKFTTSQETENSIEVDTAALGGLSLMERMLGYDRVILVDSMETGQHAIGSVHQFPLDSLQDPMAGHSASTHDTTLMTALQTAQSIGTAVPQWVDIVAIEAQNVYDFSEELSPPVADAVPIAVKAVLDLLTSPPLDQPKPVSP